MAKNVTPETFELVGKIIEERYKQRNRLLRTFIPDKPDARPAEYQIKFFSDASRYRLIRGETEPPRRSPRCEIVLGV